MRNYVLGALVLIFGLYAYFGVHKKEIAEEKAKSLDRRLLEWSVDDLESVAFRGDHRNVELKRDERGWVFEVPVKDRGDLSSVHAWLEAIASAERIQTVYNQGEVFEKEKFGVDKPETKIFFRNKDSEERELHVGQKVLGQNLYVFDPVKEELFTVNANVLEQIYKEIFELRDRRVWRKKDPVARAIQLKSPQSSWELKKNSASLWELDPMSEGSPPLSQSEVDSYFIELHNLRLLEIASESNSAEVLKKFGLDQPVAEINIWDSEGEEPVIFLFSDQSTKDHPNSVYVSSNSFDFVGRVHSASRETVAVPTHRFFDKNFPFQQIAASEVEAAEWTSGQAQEKLEGERLTTLVESLHQLRLSEYLLKAPRLPSSSSLALRGSEDQTLFKMTWQELSGKEQGSEAHVLLEPSGWFGKVKIQDLNDFLRVLKAENQQGESTSNQ